MGDPSNYTPLRHAPVLDDPDVKWVAIGHWNFGDCEEWCMECWDDQGEANEDKCFPTEREANAHAEKEFGLTPEQWRDGPQRFGIS